MMRDADLQMGTDLYEDYADRSPKIICRIKVSLTQSIICSNNNLFPSVNLRPLFFLFFILLTLNSYSQVTPTENDNLNQQQLENAAQEAPENADLSELLETRNYFLNHQINLNNTNRDELGQLELLNDLQIDALLRHIEVNGSLIALEEMQTIDGFDLATIRSLLPYVRLGSGIDFTQWSLKNILKNSKHELIIRDTQVLEDQKGYNIPDSDTVATRYLGSPMKIYTRYRYTSGRKISFGITGEKDAGEEFFKGSQSGYDFYSAHLMIRDLGFVRSLVVGDYQLGYGQGLVLWSSLAYGKSADVMNIKKNAQGIRAYTSVNEFSLFRGAATSLGYKYLQLDLFYSSRKLDANFTTIDSVNDVQLISSISQDGYHRTKSELEDKNKVKQEVYGAHLKFEKGPLEIGGTYYYNKINVPLLKKEDVYNTYYFFGSEYKNLGLDYSYHFRNMNVFGEVAHSYNGAVSYLNGLLVSLDPRVSVSLFNRNYTRDYQCASCNALRESSNQNERGTYGGIALQLTTKLKAASYIDVFKFPWLRYLVSAPSKGYEWLGQLTYTPSKKTELYFRYKQTVKEENVSGSTTALDQLRSHKQNNYRFNASYKVSQTVQLQSRVEFNVVQTENLPNDDGYILFQDVVYKPLGFPCTFTVRYGLFDTDSYESRIYTYENELPGVFAIPAYYYRGSRYYLMMRYNIMRGVSFWIRYGRTAYSNQKTVGSGLDEINDNHKSDLKVQVKVSF